MPTAGYLWVENTGAYTDYLCYIDASGAKRGQLGTQPGGSPRGTAAGYLWIQGYNIYYTDSSFYVRYVPYFLIGGAGTQGYIWVENTDDTSWIHYINETTDVETKWHDDTAFSNVAHVNTAFSNVAHVNVAFSNVAHVNVAFSNVAHVNTAHSDITHADTAHSDVTHADTAHSDVTHVDIPYSDTPYSETSHSDASHTDTAHSNIAHVNAAAHSDGGAHSQWWQM